MMQAEADRARPGIDEVIVPVSALNRAIAALLERTFPLAWVAGEVSNFTRAASGHWYFSLKDAAAQIRCVMFRTRAQYAAFTPREGDRIEVRAQVAMYEPRGELQLNVAQLRHTGQGRLYEAFLQLKQRLENEGLFDPSKKRALPRHPRAIGIVTSLQAAALRDVLTTLARRAPHIPLFIYPAPVQGAGAAAKLALMIECANRRAEVEVLIVCRGGGSLEDLWAFNEESLARIIAASPLPVVSGVGHETDFTIADFVADARAPTPTGAAELVSPSYALLLRELNHCRIRLMQAYLRASERCAQQLDWLAHRLTSPAEQLARQAAHLQGLAARLSAALARRAADARGRFSVAHLRWRHRRPNLAAARAALAQSASRLYKAWRRQHLRQCAVVSELEACIELLSPQRTLERGYAALLDAHGQALRAPAALAAKRHVIVHLAQGSADADMINVRPRSHGLTSAS